MLNKKDLYAGKLIKLGAEREGNPYDYKHVSEISVLGEERVMLTEDVVVEGERPTEVEGVGIVFWERG